MARPTTRDNPAPPSGNDVPASSFRDKVDDARKDVLSVLKDTNWPRKARRDVQDLIQTVETKLNPDRIPTDDTQMPEDLRVAIDQLHKELESVHEKLKGESTKYDTTMKRLLRKLKKLFSGMNRSDCTEVLKECRADVEANLTTLNVHLDSKSEQRASQEVQLDSKQNAGLIAEGSVGDDSGRLSGTPIAPPRATPAPDAGSEAPKNSPASNIPSDQPASTPAAIQPASVAAGKPKDSSLRGNLLEGAKMTFDLTEKISGALPVVGGYLGAVAKVGSTIVEMVQTMDDNDETTKRLGTHVCRLSEVLERVRKQPRQPEESQTTDGIEALREALRSVQLEVDTANTQPGLKKFWHARDQSGRLKNLQEKVRAALEEIKLLLDLNTSSLVAELYDESMKSRRGRLLDRLGDGDYGARGNATQNVTCLPGTRVGILDRIDNWIRATSDSERILWIRGMAGRGKSTIASTVAQNWKVRACCAIYHFRRGQNPSNSPLICALARQLVGSLDPELRNAILSTVEMDENIRNHLPDQQFAALFVSSLTTLKKQAFPILIIVDALDECDSDDDAVEFINLIDQHSHLLPDNVKFLLTSRPEDSLLRALESGTRRAENLDSIADVDLDIRLFVSDSLLQVKQKHRIEGDWPAPDDLSKLVTMAQGLFQWARTVVKYIGQRNALNRLSEVLESPESWRGVDELYSQILSKALEGVKLNEGKQNLLLGLLGTLVAAPYPVSLEVVATLHAEYESVKGKTSETVFNILRQEILADLNSLLLIPASPDEPLRLMHTSIRDLLVDRRRCGDRPYWVDLEENHQRLASACIRQMNQHLRENICNLSDLSKPSSEIQDIVERELSKGIQHCCRSWSLHLTKGKRWSESGGDGRDRHEADFELFSTEKVLFWLEVMSLVGATNEAASMAKQVYDWLSQRSNVTSKSSSIVALWSDVQRFLAVFSEPISFGPLHIYASALAHCPLETELWRCYSRFAKVRTIRGLQALTWPANLWTRPTGSGVKSVAFSPDGALMAFGSDDGTIGLWDARTWRLVGEPLTGRAGCVDSVCFSPDSKLLASAPSDRTIRLWDPQTGKQVGEPLTGHTWSVRSVCFSPDGKLLASASDDRTIRLWDPQTGKQFGEPLKDRKRMDDGYDGAYSVCFSPDGKLLASGYHRGEIYLWDPQTGKQVHKLTGHRFIITSLCFSPDGKLLASGSEDRTIRLWDPQTGKQYGEPLPGHTRSVSSVCFSPDGKFLASGSCDETIRLWDPQTGKQVGEPLRGHSAFVWSVCFSPDGKLLASGSQDRTIRLWEPQTEKQFGEPLTGHKSEIKSVCFSPDGKLMASGSEDRTLLLYDLQTGKQFGEPLTARSEWFDSVCFSPDSKLLAFGSRSRSDNTIHLWDLQTGKQFGEPLKGHTSSIMSVCFSPDGKFLASGSKDRTIRLWDPQTGKQFGKPLKGDTYDVTSVRFSPDGKLLASCDGSTICLWDPHTGKQVGEPLSAYTNLSVCFSPDGKLLASDRDTGYNQIDLWDLQTGREVGEPLERYPLHVLRYSPQFFWDTLDLQPDAPSYVTSDFDNDHWVTQSSSCLFWLPSQYWNSRPKIVTLSRGKLAVTAGKSLYIFDVSSLLELTMDSLRTRSIS